MAFQASKTFPDFAKLKATFVGARDQIKDYLLFQTIINLLDANAKSQRQLIADIEEVAASTAAVTVQLYVPLGAGDGLVMETGDRELMLIPIDEPTS